MKNSRTFLLVGVLSICSVVVQSCGGNEDCIEKSWFQDADGDGFGNKGIIKSACDKPNGFVSDSTDFNDNSAAAYPGAKEICNDGIDNDGNGFTDCEDFNCENSSMIECNCGDGKDNDGDGFTDCDDNDCKGKPGC